MADYDLCVDVGNTRSKFGLFPGERTPVVPGALPKCRSVVALDHGKPIRWPSVRADLQIAPLDVVRGFVAGSNPLAVSALLQSWPGDWPPPVRIESVLEFPIEVRLEAPNRAGVDRILNAIACNLVRPQKSPAVIVDSGTATTVDAVAPDGAFEGGAILPGFELCARALNQYTALLPLISIDELLNESHAPLGTSTREAIRSGLLWGHVGAVKELVSQLCRRWSERPLVLLTGGAAPLLRPHLTSVQWEPTLSLQGLATVARHLANGSA